MNTFLTDFASGKDVTLMFETFPEIPIGAIEIILYVEGAYVIHLPMVAYDYFNNNISYFAFLSLYPSMSKGYAFANFFYDKSDEIATLEVATMSSS